MANNTSTDFKNIDDYFLTLSPDVRCVLEEIRKTVKCTVPNATETIRYQMPAFQLDKTFIYFAAFKEHVDVYPPVQSDKDLVKELVPYRGEKGNLKFPLDQPMPYELIGKVAEALSKQYSESTS